MCPSLYFSIHICETKFGILFFHISYPVLSKTELQILIRELFYSCVAKENRKRQFLWIISSNDKTACLLIFPLLWCCVFAYLLMSKHIL